MLNTGDRPVQVASHYHFFEANKALEFDRAAAFGMRLDVLGRRRRTFRARRTQRTSPWSPSADTGEITGLNNLTEGQIADPAVKQVALARAKARDYRGAE